MNCCSSYGSLTLDRALMAAGLVDRVQVTLFSVINAKTGTDPIFHGGSDFDLELIACLASLAAVAVITLVTLAIGTCRPLETWSGQHHA